MIMCKKEYAEALDKAVFPGLQGGPHNHTTVGLAVALKEAMTPEFKAYAQQIVDNSRSLAAALTERGFKLSSGGSDNHLILIDVTSKGLTGRQMAKALMRQASFVTLTEFFDPRPAMNPSGIRIGTPAITSRGFAADEMVQLAEWMDRVAQVRADDALQRPADGRKSAYREIAGQVRALCDRFKAPGLLYDGDGRAVG